MVESSERLLRLERRLEDAEARLALLDLEGEYARAWDAVEPEGWAGLFVEDGVFEMVGTGGRDDVRHQGRAALAEFCRSANGRFRGLHLLHLPALRVRGDRAESTIHFRFDYAQRGPAGLELNEVTGIYDVQYLRVAGVWRMAHRRERAVSRRHAASYFLADEV